MTEQLYEAVLKDEPKEVRRLLEENVGGVKEIIKDERWKGEAWKAPLNLACLNCRKECVEILLEFGANPNQVDMCLTPLHNLASSGYRNMLVGSSRETNESLCEITKMLLAHGADPLWKQWAVTDPTSHARRCSQFDLSKLFVEHVKAQNPAEKMSVFSPLTRLVNAMFPNKENKTSMAIARSLQEACTNGNSEMVQQILKEGKGNIIQLIKGDKWSINGLKAPLNIACHLADLDCANTLLDFGAHSEQIDQSGQMPLFHVLCKDDHKEKRLAIIKLLLHHGAQPNNSGQQKHCPINYARKMSWTEVVRLFEEHIIYQDGIITYSTKEDKTTLKAKPSSKNAWLLQVIADEDERDKTEMKAITSTHIGHLHVACSACNIEPVRALLDMGANPNQVNWDGYLPLSYLLFKDYLLEDRLEIAKLLLERGADPQWSEGVKSNMVPIKHARRTKQTELFNLMLEHITKTEGEAAASAVLEKSLVKKHKVDVFRSALLFIGQNTMVLVDAILRYDIKLIHTILEENRGNIRERIRAKSWCRWGPQVSPLSMACQMSSREIVKIFLEYDANVNQVNCGLTPLAWLLYRDFQSDRSMAVLKLLLENGADPEWSRGVMWKRHIPINFARKMGRHEVTKLFEKHIEKTNGCLEESNKNDA